MPLVLFEPNGCPTRIAPSEPLGAWARAPLQRLLEAADPWRPVVLDLRRAPLATPAEVAAVLWVDERATSAGLDLEILTGDMPSAELLDFAGVDAPVYSGIATATEPPSPAGAPRARARARRASRRAAPR